MSSLITEYGHYTMAKPTILQRLVLLIHYYQDYFAQVETDNFRGQYSGALHLYSINPRNAAATVRPQDVS